jgi:hypothetical protein
MVISIFDSNGTDIRTIDLRAVARGEFAGPTRLGIRHDSLWVLDPGLSRITWLSSDATWQRPITVRTAWRDSVGTGNSLGGPLAGGFFYGAPTIMNPVLARGLVRKVPILRMDESGMVVDTLLWLDVAPHHTAAMELGPNGEFGYVSQPIRDLTLVRASPSGDHLVVADRRPATDVHANVFTVWRVGMDGDTLAEVAVPYVPTPLTEEYLDALILPRFARPDPFAARVDEAKYRSAIWKPKYLPPLEDLVVGIDGSIWLGLVRTVLSAHSEREWVVLSPGLNQQYRVMLPAELAVMQASIRNVWGILPDSLGVPRVRRYGWSLLQDDV